MIEGLLAQCTVADGPAAEEWYARLLGRGPDARPMEGLLEWHLTVDAGLQVWAEPERAGGCTVVLRVDDVDAEAARLSARGIGHGGTEPGGGGRILRLDDPDGNRVVLISG